jgi:SAM-dependent methyltransferase
MRSRLGARVNGPLHALGRRARALARRLGEQGAGAPLRPATRYDEWLRSCGGERLDRIEVACASGGPECYARFRELDADVWALLLTREYDGYPNIRALLPGVPDPGLQEMWNGAAGAALASQGAAFYRRLCERFERHGAPALAEARVLDFGCGWGRLTRMLARDVPYERLFGCDPSGDILDTCRRLGVPAQFARSEFEPERLPFDGPFDLAFAFSVFTHLSEPAHERCLRALHGALRPGAVLIVTVRPPAFQRICELIPPALAPVAVDETRYLFAPHASDPAHPQYAGGKMSYGEAIVTLPYVRERWSEMFELLEADILLGDLFQLVLTLRRP